MILTALTAHIESVAGYLDNIPEVKNAGNLFDWLYNRPKGMITLKAKAADRDIQALVDPGSALNLLSARLAKEMSLEVTPLENLLAQAANGSDLTIYGTTVAYLALTDSRGRQQTQAIPFVVADLPLYEIFLGLPWFDQEAPKVNVATRRVLFRGSPRKGNAPFERIALEGAQEFERTMRSPYVQVFACLVATEAEEVQTGANGHTVAPLPEKYSDFADLASNEEYKDLAEHGENDLKIDLEPGTSPPHSPMYNLSVVELEVLRKYIEDYLRRGWIRRSKSSAGAPILFAKKKDGTLRLCVDYRGLNRITIKNRGALPLITESLDRLMKARVYTKLDLREAYHRVRITKGDKWKTAFRTRYGHFKYTVMPFSLTNAPAQFQQLILQTLAGLVNITCIIYLNNILIFSDEEKEHKDHVREVLQQL